MALISVAELTEHISFMRAGNTESSHGYESLYAESKRLRKMVMDFNEQGSPLLKVPNLETPRTAMREGIKRRVSGLLESAQALVTGGSSSR